jgi:hypothetical protein
MTEHQAETPTEGKQPPETTEVREAVPVFVFGWRSTGLTAGPKTIDEMIEKLESAADALHLLKEEGIVLNADTASEGQAWLVTTDPTVAQGFFGVKEEGTMQEKREEITKDSDQESPNVVDNQ